MRMHDIVMRRRDEGALERISVFGEPDRHALIERHRAPPVVMRAVSMTEYP